MLPVLLSEGVRRGRLTIVQAAEIVSGNTAHRFNLPQKGRMAVGADADLVLVDLELTRTVRPEMLGSASPFSIYDGWEITGWPTLSMVRGHVIARDGQIVGRPGDGKFLRRPPNGARLAT